MAENSLDNHRPAGIFSRWSRKLASFSSFSCPLKGFYSSEFPFHSLVSMHIGLSHQRFWMLISPKFLRNLTIFSFLFALQLSFFVTLFNSDFTNISIIFTFYLNHVPEGSATRTGNNLLHNIWIFTNYTTFILTIYIVLNFNLTPQ